MANKKQFAGEFCKEAVRQADELGFRMIDAIVRLDLSLPSSKWAGKCQPTSN
jgi:hypothetical protein